MMIGMEVEKFTGRNNFSIWQTRMMDLLQHHKLRKVVIRDKPDDVSEEDWEDLNFSTCGMIRASMTNDIMPEIITETLARRMWELLDERYKAKALTNVLSMK